jgi:hypothetical protein
MRRHLLPVCIFVIASGLMAGGTTAQAAIETWVARNGSNTGNCPITAPCRTFAFAYQQTNNGGTINVLSSGNYGPLMITKPISIVAQGVEALINTAPGEAAITIAAPGTAVVSLRGLTIDLRSGDKIGIAFFSGAALHVQDTVIRKAANGIEFQPSSGSELYVSNSTVADMAGTGIFVVPNGSGTVARATLDRVRVENSGANGMFFQANVGTSINATVRDSVIAGNDIAIQGSNNSSSVIVMIDRTAVVNNSTGILAVASLPSVTIRLGDSTVTGNGTGLSAVGGVIASYGNNKINGNTNDGSTPTDVDLK